MEENIKFKTTELAARIKEDELEILRLYEAGGYHEDANILKEQLENASNEERLRVVFIGQYTAGKSTIISALTDDKTIKIDSDISTKVTADYTWNGVTLTDTPGLYTENKEHDALTIEMIKKSDLLIYCITSDLFNQYTRRDFEKWAFEMGYARKMFLVINKMWKEAGEYEQLVENYSENLNVNLAPHALEEFSHSFVDAKDYKLGVENEDRELIKYSHFEEFIDSLNLFIKQKGLLGKLDTPIMIMKTSIDEITQKVVDDDTNRAYYALLSRIEKKVDQQRNQVSIEAHNIIRRGLRPIIDKGYELSQMIGVKDIEYTEEDLKELVSEACEKINSQLNELCSKSIEELNTAVEEVINSGVANYFFNSVSSSYNGKMHFFENGKSKFSRVQFESIKSIVEKITGKTIDLATKNGVNVNRFFKNAEVSGSPLHKAVLAIGKKLGYKFKPWQATKIVKNIGNIAKALGPITEVFGVAMDIKETVDEHKKIQKIQAEQIKNRQEFVDIMENLEKQYSDELNGIFDVYGDVLNQISESRAKVQKMMQSNDEMSKKLLHIRDDLTKIQSEIF